MSSIAQEVRAAFDELDMRQLAVLARLSPERRLQIMFDLCAFAQRLLVASELERNPGIAEEELERRVRSRILLGQGR